MNDLYLIGNGFDLAHGLKTSYSDFLLWYLNSFLKEFWQKDHYEDDLMKIDRMGKNYRFPEKFDTIPSVLQFLKENNYKRKAHHDFFDKVIYNYHDNKWVDIEYEYYTALVKLYKDFEEDRNNAWDYLKGSKPLNDCFDSITKKLTEYLSSVEISSDLKNRQIEEILFEDNGIHQIEEEIERMVGQTLEEKLFVCFNYTRTMEHYLRNSSYENNLIYIHGELEETSNPIIFGYGDEMDPHYEKIENLNKNEFLRNIKSFGYFRTKNYQRVNSFIEGEGKEFTVKILGHSCGLSDRILLNTIFEHPNCKAIKIYYYQKSETENDYFEKTQEISRHFKASGKGNMRAKIVSFEESVPLVPFVATS